MTDARPKGSQPGWDPFVVRPAAASDAEAIAAVHVRSWRGGYAGLLPQDFLDGLEVQEREQRWSLILAGEGARPGFVLVAEAAGGVVVGFASFGQARDDQVGVPAEIYAIYADPLWWGSGVGEELMTGALKILKAEEFAVYLWVLDGNLRAMRFYERHGFRPDGGTRHELLGGAVVIEHRLVRLAL